VLVRVQDTTLGQVPPSLPILRADPSTLQGSDELAQLRARYRSLDELAPGEMSDAMLAAIWRQVQALREARVAHRDLRRAMVLIGSKGEVRILDLGTSESEATEKDLDLDVAELMASMAWTCAAPRTIQAAVRVLGKETVSRAAALLQPLNLTLATALEMRSRPELYGQIRAAVAAATGEAPPAPRTTMRIPWVLIAWLAGALLGMYLLLPLMGELEQGIGSLSHVKWHWVLLGLAATAMTFVMAAWAQMGAVEPSLPLGKTTLVQLAGAFVSRLTPQGAGGLGLNARYLERCGIQRATAIVAVAVDVAAGVVVHAGATLLILPLLGYSILDHVPRPAPWLITLGIAIAVALLAGLLLLPIGRKRVLLPTLRAGAEMRRVFARPQRAVELFGGSLGVTATNALAIVASLRAFGSSTPTINAVAAYLAGATIGTISPTPGGLGAMEAGLVASLVALGTNPAQALAAVLLYRLLSFWLPILPGFVAFRYLQRRQVI